MAQRKWPLIDDDEPLLRLFGAISLASGMYWFIAPLLMISELLGQAIDDVMQELFTEEQR